MRISQQHSRNASNQIDFEKVKEVEPNLVMAFGSVAQLSPEFAQQLKRTVPNATCVGCSTAGEITAKGAFDNSLTVTAVKFEKTEFQVATVALKDTTGSADAGSKLGEQLAGYWPKLVLVFAPGVGVNGSALVEGIRSKLPSETLVTGGLAGDGGKFQQTVTLLNDTIADDLVVAIGFKGEMTVGHGSRGGWEQFGPDRNVTRVQENVLFEIDGHRALDLYKEYLGEKASGLPATGLLYPLAVVNDTGGNELIRTILNINEEDGSLILAGDIPEGSTIRLMHAHSVGLVDGATKAATEAFKGANSGDALALLISCVGRKLVMGDDVDDEVLTVSKVMGPQTTLTGFHSYGEICPFVGEIQPRLHNQTMTITWITE